VTKSKLKAFSLIELSIVILVIGILIAGIMEGRNILYKAKLLAARALSQSSDVASIKNLVVWVDATQENAITNTNLTKNVENGDSVKSWTDRSPQYTPNLVFSTPSAVTSPIFRKNAVNGLPALEFDGLLSNSTGDYLGVASTARIDQLENFAIFAVFTAFPTDSTDRTGILFKQESGANWEVYGMSFNGMSFNGPTNTISSTVVDSSGSIAYIYAAANGIKYNIPAIGFVQHATGVSSGFVSYINGAASGNSGTPKSSINSGSSALVIGKGSHAYRHFKGYISEIIMYNRALKKEEINSVTKYLGQKWGIAVAS